MKMLFAIDGELQRKVSLSFCLVDFDVQRWKKKYKKRRWKASAAAANHGAVWRETEWGSWIGSDFNQQSQEQQRKALKRKIRKSHAHKKNWWKRRKNEVRVGGGGCFFPSLALLFFFFFTLVQYSLLIPPRRKLGVASEDFHLFCSTNSSRARESSDMNLNNFSSALI